MSPIPNVARIAIARVIQLITAAAVYMPRLVETGIARVGWIAVGTSGYVEGAGNGGYGAELGRQVSGSFGSFPGGLGQVRVTESPIHPDRFDRA